MTAIAPSCGPVAALELCEVTKEYPSGCGRMPLRALDRVNLRVGLGGIFGLLGPNGSGKSTALKLLLGLLAPTSGTCRIFGLPSEVPEARRVIGYVPDGPAYPRYLTGREFLRFMARLTGVSRSGREGRLMEVLEWVGLQDAADRRIGGYSRGMLQRIGLAQALVHNPRILILDEPTAGVDALGVTAIDSILTRLRVEGRTILLTSHLLGSLERICDEVAILAQGRVVYAAPRSAWVSRSSGLRVDALPAPEQIALRHWVEARGGKVAAASADSLERIYGEAVGAEVR